MDTPEEERNLFDHVTCNISATVDEVTVPGALALDLIEQVMTFDSVHFFKALIGVQYISCTLHFLLCRLKLKLKG